MRVCVTKESRWPRTMMAETSICQSGSPCQETFGNHWSHFILSKLRSCFCCDFCFKCCILYQRYEVYLYKIKTCTRELNTYRIFWNKHKEHWKRKPPSTLTTKQKLEKKINNNNSNNNEDKIVGCSVGKYFFDLF